MAGKDVKGVGGVLAGSQGRLLDGHDQVMFDLDGVVYIGGEVIEGVAQRIDRLRREGVPVAFVTNNASRTPEAVATKLQNMGVSARAEDVVTSAQAAARLLVDKFGVGAGVMLLGGEGLRWALAEAGLTVTEEPGDAVALVSGYGPDVRWRHIMRAATLVRAGLPYVATNADMTIPTPDGLGPGHGVLVKVISDFAGVPAIVAGKPQRPLMDETIRRVGGSVPLMVGDRLDTDIEGANVVGADSLLVMTGVTDLADLASATPELRPTHVAADTEGIFEVHAAPDKVDAAWESGGWQARVSDGRLEVSGEGGASDYWRAVCCALWEHLDAHGSPADTSGATPPGGTFAE